MDWGLKILNCKVNRITHDSDKIDFDNELEETQEWIKEKSPKSLN